MLLRVCILMFIAMLGLLQGCVAVQPFPTAARAGDTITLAIGSVDGATRANTTVTYYPTSPAASPVVLTSNVRSIFNLYPDPTSPAWTNDTTNIMTTSVGHGFWQTVMVLDLPEWLAAGVGHINVDLGPDAISPANLKHVNTVNIPLEILPGTGISNSFQYYKGVNDPAVPGTLTDLEPDNQILVRSTPEMSGHYYSAIELQLYVPIRSKSSGSPPAITGNELAKFSLKMDRLDDIDKSQVSMNWLRNGDIITVSLSSPYDEGIGLRQLRFSVVLGKDSNFDFSGTPNITSARYFDVNGNSVATSPLPELKRIYRN